MAGNHRAGLQHRRETVKPHVKVMAEISGTHTSPLPYNIPRSLNPEPLHCSWDATCSRVAGTQHDSCPALRSSSPKSI